MSQNANYFTEGRALHYLLMPGDGTAYRFSILPFKDEFLRVLAMCDNPEALLVTGNYVMDSGGGHGEDFIKLVIDMPDGKGVGTVPILSLSGDDLGTNYLKTHGFGAVDSYTLVAILLAVKVLVKSETNALANASAAMLDAPAYLHRINIKAQEDYFQDSEDAESFLVDGGDQ